MKSKKQLKRNNFHKKSKDEDDIIEIKDISLKKLIKPFSLKKQKENSENDSSEDTTPYKRRYKRKKTSDDMIEIMNVELQKTRHKRLVKDISLKKERKKEKASKQSKLTRKEKSPIKRLKKAKYFNEVNQSEEDEDSKEEEGISKLKKMFKTPIKKCNRNRMRIIHSFDRKTKKSTKRNKKKEKIQQIELSEDSESENSQEKRSIKTSLKREKNDNDLDSSFSFSEKNSLGYMTIKKVHEKKRNKSFDKISRSTLKLRSKKETKKKSLLGKKRRAGKKISKLITPKKKPLKTENQSKITHKMKSPFQSKASKVRSKTPSKSVPRIKKLNKYLKKGNIEPELIILDKLISIHGLEKVLDYLCKPKIKRKGKFDSYLEEFKDSISNERTNFILYKMIFSYFNSKIKDIENTIHGQKRSISYIKSSIKNKLNKISNSENEKFAPKQLIKDNSTSFSLNQHKEEDSLIEIEADDIEILDNNEKSEEKENSIVKDNNDNSIILNEDSTSIGSHYNKSGDGKIYKYQAYYLDGKGHAIFKCYDDKCSGMGIYELDTMNFLKTKPHSLKHMDHEFIRCCEKDISDIFKELTEKNKSNAQVFKVKGEKTIKYY